MRSEVKIAMVLVLIGVVVSAIYFFSNGDKTIEVKSAKPLVTPIDNVSEGPVVITPKSLVKEDETIDIFSSGTDDFEILKDEAEPGEKTDNTVLTINLSPLDDEPTSKPAKSLSQTREEKIAQIESAANKVIPNQPISLAPLSEFEGGESTIIISQDEPTEPIVETFGQTTHVVEKGENLYRISQKYYGRGDKWRDIARANPRINPDRIHVGDKLLIPDISSQKKVSATSKPKPTGSQRSYVVQAGDTLEYIAEEQLGDAGRWREILELNKKMLKNDPRKLRAESTILLPGS